MNQKLLEMIQVTVWIHTDEFIVPSTGGRHNIVSGLRRKVSNFIGLLLIFRSVACSSLDHFVRLNVRLNVRLSVRLSV